MRISVIIPTLNQAVFIEDTILSILNQNYSDVELIIIDGGSIDNTLEIIKKYEKHIAYWISEKDKGQSNAINKGIIIATGDLITYINSDDTFLPGAFNFIARVAPCVENSWLCGSRITEFSENAKKIIHKDQKNIDELSRNFTTVWDPVLPESKFDALIGPWGIPQQACFWRKELFNKYGLFNEDMHYAFDTEFEVRLYLHNEIPFICNQPLAKAFFHDESKTGKSLGSGRFHNERRMIVDFHENMLSKDERSVIRTQLWLSELGNKIQSNRPRPTSKQFIYTFIYHTKKTTWLLIKGILRILGLIKQDSYN